MKGISDAESAAGTPQLVFVYGGLRRGAWEAFRLEGAKFVGEGWVEGSLYCIAAKPGLVSGQGGRRVKGEIYQLSPAQLRALDDSRGLAAGEKPETGGAEYRRIQILATLNIPYDDTLWTWAYEWLGPVNEALLVPEGDWMDVERPRPPPVFTYTAWILMALPVGRFLIEHFSTDGEGAQWWERFWLGATALVAGAALSLVVAALRRERARKAIIAGWIGCSIWALVQLVAGMELLFL
ncbi:gamma-glutamylcyclotransferase [Luteolibacter arcticus]|uniref:Gamma-glutamylcyclotransferase n=1 Tax=Luteolibacter arcticus TaxID=1581411 RepID=A0ABT3GHT0_9BACT|nr:gamma-glutamylcyclotransferase family protein [Luteolibacter arcticus]MCW1923064.1 gamma-glutamylcyclotransferase [Luteolibacter arcticus]